MVILGDLTDAKDYHPAELITRLTDSLTMITWLGVEVVVLKGNHDYLRDGKATFEFINHIPGCKFISKPEELYEGEVNVFCLPHTRTPLKDWGGFDFSHYHYVFIHQTAPGSVASNGQKMEGDALPSFKETKVYSGDIHVPQVIGEIEYVGSPYHVHFGDRFKPRCVLIDRRQRAVDLFHENVSRVTLSIGNLADLRREAEDLRPRDQVKLKIELDPRDAHSWKDIRRDAEAIVAKTGAELFGVKLSLRRSKTPLKGIVGVSPSSALLSDSDAIYRYVRKEELGAEMLEIGEELTR